jgi:hypothetical protein
VTVWCPDPAPPPPARADAALAVRAPASDALAAYTPGTCIIYYHDREKGALVRRVYSAASPGRLDSGQLQAAVQATLGPGDPPDRAVAACVKSLTAIPGPDTITIKLVLEKPLNSTVMLEALVETAIYFRNRT